MPGCVRQILCCLTLGRIGGLKCARLSWSEEQGFTLAQTPEGSETGLTWPLTFSTVSCVRTTTFRNVSLLESYSRRQGVSSRVRVIGSNPQQLDLNPNLTINLGHPSSAYRLGQHLIREPCRQPTTHTARHLDARFGLLCDSWEWWE